MNVAKVHCTKVHRPWRDGLTGADLQPLVEEMQPIDTQPVSVDVVGKPYTPVRPFVVTIKYQGVTHTEELRAPVCLWR